MYKVTFKFENSEDVTVFAAFGESLLEVARKTRRGRIGFQTDETHQ